LRYYILNQSNFVIKRRVIELGRVYLKSVSIPKISLHKILSKKCNIKAVRKK